MGKRVKRVPDTKPPVINTNEESQSMLIDSTDDPPTVTETQDHAPPAIRGHDAAVIDPNHLIPPALPPEMPQIQLSTEQQHVLRRVTDGENVFFTGPAGHKDIVYYST
jgi:hypothetical protein